MINPGALQQALIEADDRRETSRALARSLLEPYDFDQEDLVDDDWTPELKADQDLAKPSKPGQNAIG